MSRVPSERNAFTVRLSTPMHDLVAEEARHCGISASQFVREALLLRLGWARARRGEPMIPVEDQRTVRRLLEDITPE